MRCSRRHRAAGQEKNEITNNHMIYTAITKANQQANEELFGMEQNSIDVELNALLIVIKKTADSGINGDYYSRLYAAKEIASLCGMLLDLHYKDPINQHSCKCECGQEYSHICDNEEHVNEVLKLKPDEELCKHCGKSYSTKHVPAGNPLIYPQDHYFEPKKQVEISNSCSERSLNDCLQDISNLIDRANKEELVSALASNDTKRVAKALNVSPDTLPNIIDYVHQIINKLDLSVK